MLAHQPGNTTDLVKGIFNRLFSIRIDQTAGCRRQEAAGQQQIRINASLPKHAPHILELGHKALKILLLEGFDAGRDDPPHDGSAAIQKLPNGCRIGGENLGIGVDVQRQDVEVEPQQKVPIRVAAQVDSARPIHHRKEFIQIGFGLDIAIPCQGGEKKLHPWLVHEHERVGIALLEFLQLDVDALGP